MPDPKKKTTEKLHKSANINVYCLQFPNLSAKSNPKRVEIPLEFNLSVCRCSKVMLVCVSSF